MSKHIKKAKVFFCSVDHYKNIEKKHKTAGYYFVGAKNEKEAFTILQKAIGFGSIIVYRERTDIFNNLSHGEIIKYNFKTKEKEIVKNDTAPCENNEKENLKKRNIQKAENISDIKGIYQKWYEL